MGNAKASKHRAKKNPGECHLRGSFLRAMPHIDFIRNHYSTGTAVLQALCKKAQALARAAGYAYF
ncbi:hypothetical protein D1841_12560 [Neglecta sp. X4]|nr:hypothetical protein [Neglectibacter sp. X4]